MHGTMQLAGTSEKAHQVDKPLKGGQQYSMCMRALDPPVSIAAYGATSSSPSLSAPRSSTIISNKWIGQLAMAAGHGKWRRWPVLAAISRCDRPRSRCRTQDDPHVRTTLTRMQMTAHRFLKEVASALNNELVAGSLFRSPASPQSSSTFSDRTPRHLLQHPAACPCSCGRRSSNWSQGRVERSSRQTDGSSGGLWPRTHA